MTIQSSLATGDQLQVLVAVSSTRPELPAIMKNCAAGMAEKGQGTAPGQKPLASNADELLETSETGWPIEASRRVVPWALAPPPPATTACLRFWVDCTIAQGAKIAAMTSAAMISRNVWP